MYDCFATRVYFPVGPIFCDVAAFPSFSNNSVLIPDKTNSQRYKNKSCIYLYHP